VVGRCGEGGPVVGCEWGDMVNYPGECGWVEARRMVVRVVAVCVESGDMSGMGCHVFVGSLRASESCERPMGRRAAERNAWCERR
jgi:hypothetical protein